MAGTYAQYFIFKILVKIPLQAVAGTHIREIHSGNNLNYKRPFHPTLQIVKDDGKRIIICWLFTDVEPCCNNRTPDWINRVANLWVKNGASG